jgi:hypothetical protein
MNEASAPAFRSMDEGHQAEDWAIIGSISCRSRAGLPTAC